MEQKRLPVFAERFAELRGGMTQGEFAAFLGISRPTVGFYENGTRIPDALVLRQIAERCKVSSDWLLGLSDFATTAQEQGADELYNKLHSMMARQFDDNDIRRVSRCLSLFISGFGDALAHYETYTHYENAGICVGLALSVVAGCLRFAQEYDTGRLAQEERTEIFCEIDRIVYEAAASAYKEMGYFFGAYREAIRDVLQVGEFHEKDLRFSVAFDNLEKRLGQ